MPWLNNVFLIYIALHLLHELSSRKLAKQTITLSSQENLEGFPSVPNVPRRTNVPSATSVSYRKNIHISKSRLHRFLSIKLTAYYNRDDEYSYERN
ncbi:BgtTE-56056 [Blumeria graminis f. sp. tritici]|uniref:BgtTE-56056 n=1 Tax=Blumeria graminis f. sp. tritici TaxID=62690 RepID=A0A9X9MHV3_BLUGR|nr:BgtTE-56056 [Blumeria graminis f. sp. tritici]